MDMKIFLETDRLILRYFTEADRDILYQLHSQPEVMRYLTNGQADDYETICDRILPRFLQYYQDYENYGVWAAIEKSRGEFIGWFHFYPSPDNPEDIELGYRLKKSAWGQGYATEASQALIHKGFSELGSKRVIARAMAANTASRRVMEKVGLQFETTYIEERFPGEEQTAVIYSLPQEAFAAEQ